MSVLPDLRAVRHALVAAPPALRIPGVNHRRAVRALRKADFRVAREGKHIVMTDGRRIITIPRANPVNAFTRGGIAQDAGFSAEEFKKLL